MGAKGRITISLRGHTMRSSFALGFLIVIAGATSAAPPAPAGQPLHGQVDAWRQAHERQIMGEFTDFLALPDVATNIPDIDANAKLLMQMIEARGLKPRILSAGPDT